MVNKKKVIIIAVISVCVLCTIALAVALVLLLDTSDDTPDYPTVQVSTTSAGLITGRVVNLTDNATTMYEFYNIPYAAPPVGELRFQPPQQLETSPSDKFDASKEEVIQCIPGYVTDEDVGSEDCLVMSIRSGNLTASKPVIVWIHGGGLALYYGMMDGYSFDSEVTNTLDAVTVNINYRLAILGFISVEELWDETNGVYANNGIRDQVAALEWIQDNIAAFGGDPDSVTIIGQSGGGTAVLALLSSPLANNKFHSAISLSPAPEMRFNHTQGDAAQRFFINTLGCDQDTLADRRTCLMELDANIFSLSFVTYLSLKLGWGYFDFPMRYGETTEYVGLIIIDPVVVPTAPADLKDAQFTPDSPVPVIIANTAQENAFYLSTFDDMASLNETLVESFARITNESDMLDITHELYPDMSPQMIWDTLTTDMRATCPMNDVAGAMAESSSHQIYRLYISNVRENIADYPAYHGWDTHALFGFISVSNPSDRDLVFQDKLVEMVKRLAHNGTVEGGWGTFPGSTMVYGNTDDVASVETQKPQEDICTRLEGLDLVKYGWQN